MGRQVKNHRRRGFTTLSSKNQVTIPAEALVKAGLRAGDRLRAEVRGHGEIVLTREEDPIERFAGRLSGVFGPGYLEELQREWR